MVIAYSEEQWAEHPARHPANCVHGIRKVRCRACNSDAYCCHNRLRTSCVPCRGGAVCHHAKQRTTCKECKGSRFCVHNRQKYHCKECKGSQLCIHNRPRVTCKECGGGSICIHQKRRTHCKLCGGGSYCTHGRMRVVCADCGGGSICHHRRQRRHCQICDPNGHMARNVRSRVRAALKANKVQRSIEYVGCTIAHLKKHIESTFKIGMSWDNYGRAWHIDHIIPLKYGCPSLDDIKSRLHWTNTQALFKKTNIAKGNRYIG